MTAENQQFAVFTRGRNTFSPILPYARCKIDLGGSQSAASNTTAAVMAKIGRKKIQKNHMTHIFSRVFNDTDFKNEVSLCFRIPSDANKGALRGAKGDQGGCNQKDNVIYQFFLKSPLLETL